MLTTCKMITTKSCALRGCPILSINCCNPFHSLVFTGWYSKKMLLSARKVPVSTSKCTARQRHGDFLH